eukprot:7861379-Pyramimonas_sp.AAC.1
MIYSIAIVLASCLGISEASFHSTKTPMHMDDFQSCGKQVDATTDGFVPSSGAKRVHKPVSYTHLRAHETGAYL